MGLTKVTYAMIDGAPINVLDYGAVGDGVTNDTAAFDLIEASFSDAVVDLSNKTYLIDNLPTNNYYFNGYIKDSSDDYVYDANRNQFGRNQNSQVAFGPDCGTAWADWVKDNVNNSTAECVAIGSQCLTSQNKGRSNVAIGNDCMDKTVATENSIAIGGNTLRYVNNTDNLATETGTRNVAVGDTALAFVETGARNVGFGRNSGQCVMGNYSVALGPTALGGYGPTTWDGNIQNSTPLTADNQIAIGYQAGRYSNADNNICIGYRTGESLGAANRMIAIGSSAGYLIGSTVGFNGNTLVTPGSAITGTYVIEASTVGYKATCTSVGHGLSNGFVVYITMTPYTLSYMTVSNATADTFVLENKYCETAPATLSGSFSISKYINNTPVTQSYGNIVIGNGALNNSTTIASYNLTIGDNSSQKTTGQYNVALGFRARQDSTSGDKNTAVGVDALRLVSYENCSALGYEATTTGDNQVQLGNSATTTYAYGAVQNRSDERDKADIQDTQLGLNFIEKLRPVDFKWDYRSDYTDETGKQIKKDGSKKRTRFHHGLIAQEVKAACESVGVDFGGYQDHKVNGGEDVLSIGYEELIAPLIKAVQELSARVKELESK